MQYTVILDLVRLYLDTVDWPSFSPLTLLECWLSHLTRKIVSEMTYNVSSDTLNHTIPYHTKRAIQPL